MFTKFGLKIFAFGLILAPLVPAEAATPENLLPAGYESTADHKLMALHAIEAQLLEMDPNCRAFDLLLEYQEQILSGEAESSLLRQLIEDQRRQEFALAFAAYSAR